MGVVLASTLLSLALAAAIGCTSSVAPSAAHVRATFENADVGCRLEREDRIRLGGLKLAAVRYLARASDDADVADTLSKLKRVEVAKYRVVTPRECGEVSSLGDLEWELKSLGWWPMVAERDESEYSWVFARGDADGDIDGLFVVTARGDEFEMVRIEGRIDRILADALADDPDRATAIIGPTR